MLAEVISGQKGDLMTSLILTNIIIWLIMLAMLGFTKYSFGGIAMFIVLLLVLTGCVEPKVALAKFADQNIIMMPGLMMVAAGFSKTRLIKNIGNILYKVSGGSFEKCIAIFMVILFFMGFVLGAALTRLAIVYPLILEVCEKFDKSPSKAMFPLAALMLCDQTSFPLGSGAVAYVRLNGFLESAGYTFGDAFTVWDPFIARFPICLIMLAYFIFFGLKLAPDTPPVEIKGLNMKQKKAARDLTDFQDKMAIIIFVLMTALLITADKTGLAQWEITTACAVLMYFTGVNTVKESHDAIPLSLMMLLVGAYVMSEALVHTGTGLWIGQKIAALLGDHPSTFVLYFMFCLIVIILTQFMNNGATANLFFPIAIMTCEVLGCSAKGLMLAIQNASLIAWFFPTATPIMPLVMESGGYNVKSLIKQGIIPAVLKLVTMILWTSYMFPAFK